MVLMSAPTNRRWVPALTLARMFAIARTEGQRWRYQWLFHFQDSTLCR